MSGTGVTARSPRLIAHPTIVVGRSAVRRAILLEAHDQAVVRQLIGDPRIEPAALDLGEDPPRRLSRRGESGVDRQVDLAADQRARIGGDAMVDGRTVPANITQQLGQAAAKIVDHMIEVDAVGRLEIIDELHQMRMLLSQARFEAPEPPVRCGEVRMKSEHAGCGVAHGADRDVEVDRERIEFGQHLGRADRSCPDPSLRYSERPVFGIPVGHDVGQTEAEITVDVGQVAPGRMLVEVEVFIGGGGQIGQRQAHHHPSYFCALTRLRGHHGTGYVAYPGSTRQM